MARFLHSLTKHYTTEVEKPGGQTLPSYHGELGVSGSSDNSRPSQIEPKCYTKLNKIAYTLISSNFNFRITSWGGNPESKLRPLSKIQKRCIRIIFGNKNKYLAKNTEKDYIKPLLNMHNLMTVHNLYVYHCSMDTFKTLKYRIPISLYSLYLLSYRKEAFLITPLPNSQLTYNASKIWNTIRETIDKSDLSISICSLKSTLKKHILSLQNLVLL